MRTDYMYLTSHRYPRNHQPQLKSLLPCWDLWTSLEPSSFDNCSPVDRLWPCSWFWFSASHCEACEKQGCSMFFIASWRTHMAKSSGKHSQRYDQLPMEVARQEMDEETIMMAKKLCTWLSNELNSTIYPCDEPMFLVCQRMVVVIASIPGSGNTLLRYKGGTADWREDGKCVPGPDSGFSWV